MRKMFSGLLGVSIALLIIYGVTKIDNNTAARIIDFMLNENAIINAFE